jgi:hypothetical protein
MTIAGLATNTAVAIKVTGYGDAVQTAVSQGLGARLVPLCGIATLHVDFIEALSGCIVRPVPEW